MTSRTRGAREEGKPWEATVNGELNLASYAAIGTIGLASLAAELLAEQGQPVGPTTLPALTGVLAKVVADAQATVTGGSTDWAEGANTRIRGALRTVVTIRPLPFGGDQAAWAAWMVAATRFAVGIVKVGIDLFEQGPADPAALYQATVPATV